MSPLRVAVLLVCLCLPACGQAADSRTFDYASGESLHYQTNLSGKPPLLLLHGLGLSVESWTSVWGTLAGSFDLYAIDMRGFGQSSKPPDQNYSIHDQALRIVAFLERQSLKDVVLIGHSYGGAVALMTYLMLKERNEANRVTELVLLDAPAYAPDHPPLFIRVMRTRFLGALIFHLAPRKVSVRYVMTHTYSDKKKVDPKLVGIYADHWKSSGAAHALLASTRQLYPKSAAMLSGRISSVDVPALLIWGEDDRLVPPDMGRRLKAEMLHSRIATIRQCAHVPQEESPEETLKLMLPFLKTAGERSTSP